MNIKYSYLLSIIGFVLTGWGAGMVSVHYLIGNSSPINTVNAVGLAVAMIGMGILIPALTKLKGQWSFEVIED